MEIVAYLKYLRTSPKKMKGIGRSVKSLSPLDAIDRLIVNGNKTSKLLARAIKSALMNATNNLKLDASSLRIKKVEILKGPFFKRWQPVSKGMAHQIKKRTTHIKVTLEDTAQPIRELKIQKDNKKLNKKESKTPVSS